MTYSAMSSSADYHVRFNYSTLLAVYFRHFHVLFVYSLVNFGNSLAAMHGSCIDKILDYSFGHVSITRLFNMQFVFIYIFMFTLDP